MNNVALSGTSRGLGKWLKKDLSAVPLIRKDLIEGKTSAAKYDLLIHCAFERYNAGKKSEVYIQDSLNLASQILRIKASRYIFMSSIECNNETSTSPYVAAKIGVEKLFAKKDNYLNIRLPSLYGLGMKKNQIFNLATQSNAHLTLHKNSTFSLLSYGDLAGFVRSRKAKGTISLLSDVVTLESIASIFGTQPSWGQYIYQTHEGSLPRFQINLNESLLLYKKFILSLKG